MRELEVQGPGRSGGGASRMNWATLARKNWSRTYAPAELAGAGQSLCLCGQISRGGKSVFPGTLTWCTSWKRRAFSSNCIRDPDTLARGPLLHDSLEDTTAHGRKTSGARIRRQTAGIGWTASPKISTRAFRDSEERKAENLRKIGPGHGRRHRVIVIKLADRLHNHAHPGRFCPPRNACVSPAKPWKFTRPWPIAWGWGASRTSWRILAFRHLHTEEYQTLGDNVAAFQEERQQVIADAQAPIEKLLGELDIRARVYGRIKHLYSLWVKMRTQDKNL